MNVWVIRADFGVFTPHFLTGGYVALGGIPNHNLSAIKSRGRVVSDLPTGASGRQKQYRRRSASGSVCAVSAGNQTGRLCNHAAQRHGMAALCKVAADPYYFFEENDGCPYQHRRKIKWAERRVKRAEFSFHFRIRFALR